MPQRTTSPEQAIEYYFERGWTDGLPVVPATAQLVARFLDAAGLAPTDSVGYVPERFRCVSAEKVAINAILAGCRAEYMPVVVAAVRALCAPEADMHVATLSTSGSAPLVIVNGPCRLELGLNSGANLFGPGVRANATIGRALRLVIMNVLGGTPGTFDRSSIGHPGKYTFCIAEDEEHSPWAPLHVERGFPRQASTVTLVHSEAPRYVRDDSSRRPEQLLSLVAEAMCACSPYGGAFTVVLNPEHRQILADSGWSKRDAATFLRASASRPLAELKRSGRLPGTREESDDEGDHRFLRSEEDLLIVAGGGSGVMSAVVPPWAGGELTRPVTEEVRVGDHCPV